MSLLLAALMLLSTAVVLVGAFTLGYIHGCASVHREWKRANEYEARVTHDNEEDFG